MLKRIIIKNIGLISDADIVLDKPLNIFVGEIKQGKTTILNCIKWSCGGYFPSDILKHGTANGFVKLEFENETVERKFFIDNKGNTDAKPIDYYIDNKLQKAPVKKLKEKFNPFQLNQNYFTDMNAIDKRRFLVDHFNVDTAKEDKELLELKTKGLELRAEVDNFIPLQLKEVKAVDEKELIKQKEDIDLHNTTQKNTKIAKDSLVENQRLINLDIEDMEFKLKLAKEEIEKHKIAIAEIKPIQDPKPTTEIEQQIQEAKLTNYKASEYDKAILLEGDKVTANQEKRQKLDKVGQDYKSTEKEKQNKLIEANKTHGIEGLVFIAGGNFTYENTSSEMLSTSQQAQLSSALQTGYPDAFKFESIDQGESLGYSIYDLIDKMKEEEKTALVTVVGFAPKKSEDVNVFVVDEGKVILK